MASIIEELVTIIGVDVPAATFENLKKISASFDSIIKSALRLGAEITGTVSGLAYLADRIAAPSAELDNFGAAAGQSTAEIQKLGLAIQRMGGDFKAGESLIKSVTSSLAHLMPGEYWQPLFQLLGGAGYQKVKDSPLEALLAIADRLHKMPKQEAYQWAAKLGISDPATVRLLEQGRVAVEAQMNAAGKSGLILRPDELAQLQKAHAVLQEFWREVEIASAKLLTAYEPAIKKVLESVQKWIKEHQQLIERDLPMIAKWLTYIAGVVIGMQFLGAIAGLLKAVGGLLGIFSAFGPAGWVLLGLGMVAAAVYAIVTPWDDVKNAVSGATGAISDFFSKSGEAQAAETSGAGSGGKPKSLMDRFGDWAHEQNKALVYENYLEAQGLKRSQAEEIVERFVSASHGNPKWLDEKVREAHVFDVLRQKFGMIATAGIMGNLLTESDLDPTALNKDSGAFGIAQWWGKRKTALLAFAAHKKLDPKDMDTQLQFLMEELGGPQWYAAQQVSRAKSPREAAIIFERLFEVAKGAGMDKRIFSAERIGGQYMITHNQTFNIKSTDPKGVAREVSRVSTIGQRLVPAGTH